MNYPDYAFSPVMRLAHQDFDNLDYEEGTRLAEYLVVGPSSETKGIKAYRRRSAIKEILPGGMPRNTTRIYKVVKLGLSEALFSIEPHGVKGRERIRNVCKCGKMVPLSKVSKHKCKIAYVESI